MTDRGGIARGLTTDGLTNEPLSVESRRDEGVTQGVRPDALDEADAAREQARAPPCGVAVEARGCD